MLEKVKSKTSDCTGLVGDDFGVCFTNSYSREIIKADSAMLTVKTYRDVMAEKLRNYTCEDTAMQTSTPVRTANFTYGGLSYKTDILLELPHAKIWTVSDFISEEHCNILEEHGRSRLHTATVAGIDGKAMVSQHRKAQQAAYEPISSDPNDPLVPLRDMMLAITNIIGGYNLTPAGQEHLTIIQYNKDDEYTRHCDGSCDGTAHRPGGRVASALLYCQVADVGGGTTFTKANVFVKPTRGMATFFSYKGPDGMMDDGFTEHSGCKVIEGQKWITTYWMRDGVTTERPWFRYDPSGVVTDYSKV